MEKTYKRVKDEIIKAHKIALFMHINPDGDCIGSVLALYMFLKKMDKDVCCFSANQEIPVPKKLQFLPHSNEFNSCKDKKFDLSICLDVADPSRLGDQVFKIFLGGKTKIVIDHHVQHVDFVNIVLREHEAASTTQILYKLLCFIDKSIIDKDIATALYAGLVTDSGAFSFSNTSKETMFVAGELISYGIDNSEINRKLIKDLTIDVFNLKNRVYSNAKFYEKNQLGIIVFRKEDFIATKTSENETEGLINGIINIDSVELAVSISEIGDKQFKVSFRSKHNVNASACAKCFGGGGHFFAAGCRVYGYFDDVYDKILNVAKEMMSYA